MNLYNSTKLNSSAEDIIVHSYMRVQKRGLRGLEIVKFDKITERVRNLCKNLNPIVDPTRVAQLTIKNLYDGITTEELDRISAKIAESLKLTHPDYSKLAAKILVSNLHKTTPRHFSECMAIIGRELDIKSEKHYNFIAENASAIDSMIISENDYLFDYFGYKTLEKSYLVKINETVRDTEGNLVYADADGNIVPRNKIEFSRKGRAIMRAAPGIVPSALKTIARDRIMDRPQYVFMRVAIAIYIDSDPSLDVVLQNIQHCYTLLSQMYFTHATPTLFNSCAKVQQLLSCFLLGTGDSIEEIMQTVSKASFISKWAGGIGIWMHCIRPRESIIRGTNGRSSGLPKQLKIYNEVARCWDQGGKRLGAFAIYLEPWHGDIMKFLQMKLNQGAETERARDLFYAMWTPDLFIKRALANNPLEQQWSLFNENSAPGLSDVYDGMEVCAKCNYCANKAYAKFILGDSSLEIDGLMAVPTDEQAACEHRFTPRDVFTDLYTDYESEGLAVNTINAREVLDAICDMQRESGTPYISFKDHANRMTNQKNIGTIKSSNLCNEIYEWSSAKSYACCTLASINLKKFLIEDGVRVEDNSKKYRIDHEKLHEVVRLIARNLDIIIDVNHYPVSECEQNSRDYRPIGIGIQALADIFAIMRIPFLSDEAAKVDIEIAETVYHAALTESCELARKHGSYTAFAGSPASRGILQTDLWMQNQSRIGGAFAGFDPRSDRYDWNEMKQRVKEGLRNSLLIAFMPTVSTSQIMGNNESFEPFASNIYTKTTLAGKFTVTNSAMIHHLIELGLWSDDMRRRIINDDGSIQNIAEIPAKVREIYKTVWEMKQSEIMKRAALRLAFIDQSQSLNIYVKDNSNATLRAVLFAGWKLGLKTGSYYVRTMPAAKAIKNNIAASNSVNNLTNGKNSAEREKTFLVLAPSITAGLNAQVTSADSEIPLEPSSEESESELIASELLDTVSLDDELSNGALTEKTLNAVATYETAPIQTAQDDEVFTAEDDAPVCYREEGCTFCSA